MRKCLWTRNWCKPNRRDKKKRKKLRNLTLLKETKICSSTVSQWAKSYSHMSKEKPYWRWELLQKKPVKSSHPPPNPHQFFIAIPINLFSCSLIKLTPIFFGPFSTSSASICQYFHPHRQSMLLTRKRENSHKRNWIGTLVYGVSVPI